MPLPRDFAFVILTVDNRPEYPSVFKIDSDFQDCYPQKALLIGRYDAMVHLFE